MAINIQRGIQNQTVIFCSQILLMLLVWASSVCLSALSWAWRSRRTPHGLVRRQFWKIIPLSLQPWRCRQHVSPKRWYVTISPQPGRPRSTAALPWELQVSYMTRERRVELKKAFQLTWHVRRTNAMKWGRERATLSIGSAEAVGLL